MISDVAIWIFIISIVVIAAFFIWSMHTQKKRQLLHKLMLFLSIAYISWIIPLILMRFTPADNQVLMYILDCATQPGGSFCPPLYLCIAFVFVNGSEKLSKWQKAAFILPVITVLVAWTNPLHHLYYREFSVVRSEVVFGPYILISGVSNYFFLLFAIVYMVRFGIKNKMTLYMKQCILLCISGFCPLATSFYATFSGNDVSIAATPMSFLVTLILNAVVIFRLHVLDIKPIATQHILNAISDSYVVLSDTGHVVKYNGNFERLFGKEYGITENKNLADCISREDVVQKSPIYNMLSALESSRQGESLISYEQSVAFDTPDGAIKKYFVVDVSPLEVNGQIYGFVMMFKDITQLRNSMKKLQDSQERMMEQERFAFLGQMIGGLAHNLKTPIMSISGCISAAEALVDECEESLTDEEVLEEDYREIYGEMRDWFVKVKESTAYMSDIITAIKGQAANISTDENVTFTIDETLKRSMLLMRHELLNSGCKLTLDYDRSTEIVLQGDINNLVQVIGNLLNNAIYAQKQNGGGEIVVEIRHDKENLKIMVKDRGTGISPNVLDKLFKSMVTNKGTMGTGLGLYISNAVIRGKFNGEMWGENREGGGSIFGISIPLELVQIKEIPQIKRG
ncbi:MAG: PAS domain-containing protein [Ruminococcaceae bacterium]|nr:PAS domain-containing protein [Oscillospiraceae bacterium]